MHPALLLLADSRLPAGGHAHSGGAEAAIVAGTIADLASLAAFLRGRLHTTGLVTAALAAAACAVGARIGPEISGFEDSWAELEAEADARTASPALRHTSRLQGKLLLRVARRLWPAQVLDDLAAAVPEPHHPIALGAAVHAAGAAPSDAALAAAYHAITGPATAAVRLLGLDPVEVHRLLAGLAPDLTEVATTAVTSPDLPACSAPALDLLAERHARAAVRLFVS